MLNTTIKERDIMAFCNKKDVRPTMQMPFQYNGALYATDSFHALRMADSSAYTGELANAYVNVPNMEPFFSFNNITPDYLNVNLPTLKELKEILKGSKKSTELYLKAFDSVFRLRYVMHSMKVTGSAVISVNFKNRRKYAYMANDDQSIETIIMPFLKTFEDVPEFCVIRIEKTGERTVTNLSWRNESLLRFIARS